MANTLFWFTHDLRVQQHKALQQVAASTELLCIYCLQTQWPHSQSYQTQPMSQKRLHILKDALFDLRHALSKLNQELFIFEGSPLQNIRALLEGNKIDTLVCSRQFGWYEKQILAHLSESFPDLTIVEIDTFTLFSVNELPFSLSEIPASYSQFRKKMPKANADLIPALTRLPHIPEKVELRGTKALTLDQLSKKSVPLADLDLKDVHIFVRGGETAGKKHLDTYFNTIAPAHYKETRNQLEGLHASSRLSLYLSQGSLSVHTALAKLLQFETTHGVNDSTNALYLELLWREYFQWLALNLGKQLFSFKGLRKSKPLQTFYPERFKKWCSGTTPFPLVNACMRELLTTGYMSNRGRQIVASCLINELDLDWRYGAAWFERHLLDYDPAVNWGNWQYIAGVGVDPRGGRHFNITKQTELYDPDGYFQQKWSGFSGISPLDSQDYVGWPVLP